MGGETNPQEKNPNKKPTRKIKGCSVCTALQGLWDGIFGSPWATKLLDTAAPQPALQISAHTELPGLYMEPPAPSNY